MADDDFRDVLDMYNRFRAIGKMGAMEGWFALSEFKMQTDRQLRFQALASEALASRRALLNEMVLTVSAQVEAEVSILRLMEKRAQILSGQPSPPQLSGAASSPASTPGAVPPAVEQYVSNKTIEDAALQAAISYTNSPDKTRFWAEWEKSIANKHYPESVVTEIKDIAQEVIKRTAA